MRGLFSVLTLFAMASLSTTAVAQVKSPDSSPGTADTCPAARSDVAGTIPVHEPAAGKLIDITPNPAEALSFDFSPFDAQASRRGRDLVLRFADNGVVILRRVHNAQSTLPIPVHLPDGTVISLCELLRAMPGQQAAPETRKIPTEKIPAEKTDQSGHSSP